MTPQEQEMLDGLIGRVRNAQLTSKDADADRRIHDALGGDSNALYILCQTVLVQDYALEQAEKQLQDLKKQATQTQQQAPHEPTFLEKIFGKGDAEPAQPQPRTASGQPGYGAPVYDESAQPGRAQYGQPGYTRPGYGQQSAMYPPAAYPPPPGYGTSYAPYGGGGLMSSGGGGFLQGALQTAAGVALGEMAFQSVESLFRGFGHVAGYGSDRAMGFGDVSSGSGSGDYGQDSGFFSREQAENGVNDQLSPDIEDRRGESSSSFADAGGGDTNAFTGSQDVLAGSDDSSSNGYDSNDTDSSDFADSGSFDDGGSFSDDN